MLADRRYCYPLTITDFATRYLITCDALATTQTVYAVTVFERTFREFGLPRAIRTDNGLPFASGHALYGLSKLSVWWLRLGIQLERIRPGHPEQNGRHERMHLTLKQEATKPAAANTLQQQARFDDFLAALQRGAAAPGPRDARPRRALRALAPPVRGLTPLEYPLHDWTGTVTHCGRICYKSRKVNLSQVFRGPGRGRQAGRRPPLARHLHGLRSRLLRRRDVPARADREPVRPESVTHVSGINRHPCVRNGPAASGGESGIRTRGTVSRTHAFQACALNHSAISPRKWTQQFSRGDARESRAAVHSSCVVTPGANGSRQALHQLRQLLDAIEAECPWSFVEWPRFDLGSRGPLLVATAEAREPTTEQVAA